MQDAISVFIKALKNSSPGISFHQYKPLRPLFGVFFLLISLQKRSLRAKTSIKRVRNLSQNAGNGHFSDSNFKTFLGEHAPRPP